MSITRRGLIKGATGFGLAGITLGLAGCAPSANQPTAPAASNPDLAETGSSRPAGYMCESDWLGAAPAIGEDEITESLTFDVVVVGGGDAGTQAALAAAQEGASVAVIEKRTGDVITQNGGDICSYNSKLMIEWGFGPYNLDEIVNEYVRRANGRCSTEVVRSFVYNSGEMMDNICSLLPEDSTYLDRDGNECCVQIAYGKPNGSDYPIEIDGYKTWASTVQAIESRSKVPVGKQGLTDISRLTEIGVICREAAEDLGAAWYCGHEGVVCTQSDDGSVTGVIAKDENGAYKLFEASKGVILSTGDFSADKEMVWNLCTESAEYAERHGKTIDDMSGMTQNDGAGHKMGCWAGGAIEEHPRSIHGNFPGLVFGPWGMPPCLWMNCKGRRFMNENLTNITMGQSIRQPVSDSGIKGNFAIMDRKYLDYLKLTGVDHGAPNWGYQPAMDSLIETMDHADIASGTIEAPCVAIVNRDNPMMYPLYVGNTAEEALSNAGMAGAELQEALKSIERYNELCKKGVDEDFAKDPRMLIPIDEGPFYVAVQDTASLYSPTMVTQAGLNCNGNFQVLKADGSDPIPGLYAAGLTMGPRFGSQYTCPSAGNCLGTALTSGRVAGKHAANL